MLAAFLWSIYPILSPVLVGGFLLFLLMGFKESPIARRLIVGIVLILLIWFFVKAQGVIFPFLVSFVLAYLFDPLADGLEKWRIPRTLAVFLLLFLTLAVLILVGMILIPSLIGEIQDLISRIPNLANKVAYFVQRNVPRLLEFFRIDPVRFQQSLLEEFPARAEQVLSNILKGVTGIGALLGQILNVILIPILTFYFLKDFDRVRSWGVDFIPRKYRNICHFYLWRMNRILGGYLRGQLTVCTIVGLFTGLGLALFNLPFAILLGFLTGVLNIIPYIGLYISLGLAILTTFFTANPFISMLKIGGIFLVVQAAEAYVISPKIVGERVGLHPVAVIFSILVFSRFLGFWGLIIGVPTAALIKFMIDEWKRRQKWREMLVEK
jgi:predicted PurR-regulated permease PerM